MLHEKTKSSLVILVIAAFLMQFIGLPAEAYASWPKKQNTPGIMSTETIILIGVGTAALVLLIAYASKSKDKDSNETEKKNNEEEQEESDENDLIGLNSESRSRMEITKTNKFYVRESKKVSFMPLLGFRNTPSMPNSGGFDLKNSAVVVGLSVNF